MMPTDLLEVKLREAVARHTELVQNKEKEQEEEDEESEGDDDIEGIRDSLDGEKELQKEKPKSWDALGTYSAPSSFPDLSAVQCENTKDSPFYLSTFYSFSRKTLRLIFPLRRASGEVGEASYSTC